MLFAGSLGLDYLLPSAPLGLLLLAAGIIFSCLIVYILYISATDKPSLHDIRSETKRKARQETEIAKLYPKL